MAMKDVYLLSLVSYFTVLINPLPKKCWITFIEVKNVYHSGLNYADIKVNILDFLENF